MASANARLALVTGAAHRLGKAFALSLAHQGFAVVVHFHSAEAEAQHTLEELQGSGAKAFLHRADLREPAQIDGLFAFIDSLPHRLGVLVNSAAVMSSVPVENIAAADWDGLFDLNLRAAFLCAQQAARRMTEGGLIVNVTDVAAQKSWHAYPAYTVSKAALESLTRVMARALGPKIRVNAIAPGLVLQSDIVPPEQWEKLVRRLPSGRPAAMAEIAAALEFLVKNEYVTGQSIVVDGGYSLL